MRRLLAALTPLMLLAAGCGGVETLSFPKPPPTPASSTTTTTPDLTGAPVNVVGGVPVAFVPIGPGLATLSGIVLGPDAPVGGALVHIERLVGDAIGSDNVVTQADGTWTLPGILGGRYRVRAWRSPDLAMPSPQIFFLGGTDNKSLTLPLTRFDTSQLATTVNPNPPRVGRPANLLVQLTSQLVDANGVVHATPMPSAVLDLLAGADVFITSANPATTDANGEIIWQFVCLTPGPVSLTATNGADTHPIDVADCVGTAGSTTPPSTEATTGTATTAPSRTTSTTPFTTSSTTSTVVTATTTTTPSSSSSSSTTTTTPSPQP